MFSRIKNATKSLLGLGYEAIQPEIEPIAKPLRETRNAIYKVLDRARVVIGYNIDKTAGNILKQTAEIFRPNYSTVTEWKKGWAEKQAPFTEDGKPPETDDRFFVLEKLRNGMNALIEWGEAMDRTPRELGTDEDIMRHEEELYHANRTNIEQEKAAEVIESSESDRLVEKQLLHHLNKNRALPLVTFPRNHQMSQIAQQRASYSLQNPQAETAPLHNLYYPAKQREIVKKPLSQMTAQDHEISNEAESQTDGSLLYKVPQAAEQYTEQARSRQGKAFGMQYEEFTALFDLEQESYPSNAQYQQALDLAMKRESFASMMRRDDVRIAFGFCRQGARAALTCFAVVDDSLRVEARPMQEEDGIENSDDWWFQQIPENLRGDGSLFEHVLSSVGGYSSYILYEFSQEIEKLRQSHRPALEIDFINDPQKYVEKPIKNLFGDIQQTLKFPIMVNGKEEVLHLIRGTDKLFTSPGSIVSQGEQNPDEDTKKKKKRAKGEVMTTQEFIEKAAERLEPREQALTTTNA